MVISFLSHSPQWLIQTFKTIFVKLTSLSLPPAFTSFFGDNTEAIRSTICQHYSLPKCYNLSTSVHIISLSFPNLEKAIKVTPPSCWSYLLQQLFSVSFSHFVLYLQHPFPFILFLQPISVNNTIIHLHIQAN